MSEYMKICCGLMKDEAVGEDVGLVKLMKLVYISHGFLLVTEGRNPYIGKDKFRAWGLGPVLPELHWAYHRGCDERLGGEGFRRDVLYHSDSVDNEEHREIIGFVANKYGRFSGRKLTEFTHKEGTPWQLCYRERTRDIVIPDELIKQYYDLLVKNLNKIVEERQQAQRAASQG